MGSLLFGVSPPDALTFAAVATLLVAIAAAASLVPALRASRIDPLIALRDESADTRARPYTCGSVAAADRRVGPYRLRISDPAVRRPMVSADTLCR